MAGTLAIDPAQTAEIADDSWLRRAIQRRANEDSVDPESPIAAFNSSI